MKNKLLFFYLIIFLSINQISYSENELQFESKSIEYDNEKEIITAKEGVKILGNKNLEIIADQSKYFKKKNFLEISGNIEIKDLEKNIIINADEINYNKTNETFISIGKTNFIYNKTYKINSSNLTYLRNENKVISKNQSIFFDNLDNKFITEGFSLDTLSKTFRSNHATFIDKNKNRFISENFFLDLNKEQVAAKDIKLYFSKGELGNNARLKGNGFISENNITTIEKGIFTACKERKDDCPPWSISAEKIVHDKEKKTINYTDSWLKLYDFPVFYFPKFFHPDPTVKRQSGFLTPSMLSSSTNGDSVRLPYYHVISDNKDITFTPRIYFNNTFMIQNEFRQVEKNTDFISDFSLKKLDKSSKSHIFANALHVFDGNNNSTIEFNLEKTSNDTYLRSNDIKSGTKNINQSLLNSFIKYENFDEKRSVYIDANIYEDLTKEKNSDKYQYILPSFKVSNLVGSELNLNGRLNLINSGSINQNETNKTISTLVNDLVFKSNSYYSKLGTVSNINLKLKNANKEMKKNQNSEFTLDNYGLISIETQLPFQKKTGNYTSNLTPKILGMYSPSKNENIKNSDKRISSTNIFSSNRLGLTDSLEGGQSFTIGIDYGLEDNSNNIINASIGQIFRDVEDKRLPIKSKMRNKSSDLVGDLGINLNDVFKLNYNFSADNNLDFVNYNKLETELSINNFVTKFDFLEENNDIGNESYLETNIFFPFRKNKTLYYKTRRNRKTDLTEFYNLIYEFKNDCLVAAIEYNKNFYSDRDLKPSENIFFTLTFTPFTKIDSPNLIND